MRIVHVTPYFYPAWSLGGVPRVVYELTRRLAAAGHQVTVITTDTYDERSRVVVDSNPVDIGGVKTFYLPNISNALAYSLQLFTPYRMPPAAVSALTGADAVHMHVLRHVLNNIAMIYLRDTEAPFILSAHGTVPRVEGSLAAKYMYDLTLGRRIMKRAALYHAVSNAEKKQYLKAGVPESRIRVIYDGISAEDFIELPPRGEFKSMLGIAGDKKLVLFLGKITPRKGVDFLIGSIGKMERKDVVLAIAGNTIGTSLEQLKKLVSQHGIKDKVVFTGLPTGPMRLAAYRDADITVAPSEYEVFGLVPFESLLCGTPVIVADDCGACEIVSKAGAGYPVEYGNTIELATAIDRLLVDRRAAKLMADRGRRFIQRELSWDVLADRYAKLYQEAVTG